MSAKIILLVDDEDSIRVSVKAILVRENYHVLEAANGSEALAIVNRVNGAVDVLVTDIRMPGLNGYELAEAVRSSYPSLPVVYISGYATNDDLAVHNRPEQGEAFVAKPFMPKTLLDVISSVIAAAVPTSGAPAAPSRK
jgi:two-component system, cell cycle sensor histidine kinase and response regulator CckA